MATSMATAVTLDAGASTVLTVDTGVEYPLVSGDTIRITSTKDSADGPRVAMVLRVDFTAAVDTADT